VNTIEIFSICVGKRHNKNTLKTADQCSGIDKGQGKVIKGVRMIKL
jgi:hypothetical protein